MRRKISAVAATGLFLFVCVQGCTVVDFKKEGTIVPVTEPTRDNRARVTAQFNKATALLAAARDEKTGAIDPVKLDEAIAAYKEIEKIDPDNVRMHKQLGIIYEFLKDDEKAAYTHYSKYIALGGTESEIIAITKQLAEKYEPKQ
jgi:hypothetical protein